MKNSFGISFGVWLLVLPLLGIPGAWRNTLIFVSGLFLVLVAVWPTIMKKMQIKPKKKIIAEKEGGESNLPNAATDFADAHGITNQIEDKVQN